MTVERKRGLSEEQIQEALARGTAQGLGSEESLPDFIAMGLVSGEEEKILKSLALLCSIDLPLDSLLRVSTPPSNNSDNNNTLLNSITTLVEGNNSLLAAEAAAVLRSWVMNVRNVHILYAHLTFPWLLSLLERATKTIINMGEAFHGQRNELVLWEHWLSSVLLSVWAIVEEIPQSLPQLNEKGSAALLELTCSLFEKKMFFNQDTLLLLLRLLLCVMEDNGQLHSLNPTQFIRLESMLTNIKVSEGDNTVKSAHLKLLANLLVSNIDGSRQSKVTLKELASYLNLTISGDDELEYFADILESMANVIAEEDSADQGEIININITLIDSILAQRPSGSSLAAKCIERSLGCIFNVLCVGSDMENNYIINLWNWCTSTLLTPLLASSEDAKYPLLTSIFGELCRFLMLRLLHTNKPVLSSEQVNIIYTFCNVNENAEEVIIFWLPILAILLPEDQKETMLEWLNEKCIVNISKDLSWRACLGMTEVLEELLKHDALSDRLRGLLRDKRPLILRKMRRQLCSDEDKQDEILYVESILSNCV